MTLWNPRSWFGRDARNEYKDIISEERAIEIIGKGIGVPSIAGPIVSETTAMRISAFYRCVSIISGTIASLPCEIFRRKDGDQRELAFDHPAFRLLCTESNPLMTANTFWKNFVWSGCTRGNCCGLIGRDRNGTPVSVNWVPWQQVSPRYSPDRTRLWYGITLADGRYRIYDQDDVLHYPFIGFDGLEGRAPMECAREALGLSTAGEEFNARYFKDGNASDLIINYAQQFDKEQAKFLMDNIEKQRTGSSRMRLPLITMGGAKADKLGLNADNMQLVESRGFQVEDICRFFGVPPHMVGHTTKQTSWGKGVEEQTLGFVKFTLRDLLKGIEQEVDRKILRDPRFYCKFNLDALLRADSKGRADYFKAAMGGNQLPGWMTVNEVRKLEGLPPTKGGDQLYVPVQSEPNADNAEPEGGDDVQE